MAFAGPVDAQKVNAIPVFVPGKPWLTLNAAAVTRHCVKAVADLPVLCS